MANNPFSLLNDLLLNSAGPIVALDEDGIVLFFNQATLEYFGLPSTIMGQAIDEVLPHPDLLRILENNETHGELFLADFERTLQLEVGRVDGIGILLLMQDISHLKHSERLKSNFVGEISRNLRSPLTAIVGYTELLSKMGELNTQQRTFVDRIMLSVNAMTRLINDLTEFEKVETDTNQARQWVDMRLIVRYAIDGLHDALITKGHTLNLSLSESLPQIQGNPVRLRQIANNLLQNAIQYTPAHGEITIRLAEEEDVIFLAVVDNGIGIPLDEQTSIFEKFYRTHATASMPASSGLGLSIVKNIAEQHGGRVWVDSQPNLGSTFTVMLPIIHS